MVFGIPSTLTPPPSQYAYYDNQDTFNADIDRLYAGFITPIDRIRSHFNALIPGSQQVVTQGYQESRCHTFFRMMGFPVVASGSSYYSPGYDPNLNLDTSAQNTNEKIAANAISNNDFILSQFYRETQTQSIYLPIFNNGGINATAISVGSWFIRSYGQQFTPGIDPLSFDPGGRQQIPLRETYLQEVFGASSATFTGQYTNITKSLLTSTHIIKPFVVDPRIDNGVKPNANRIAAPFLKDRSQLKIFDGQSTAPIILKRPYIEFVLSTVLNNTQSQQFASAKYVQGIVSAIKASDPSDQALIDAISTSNLTQTGLSVFAKYLKMIRSLITLLDQSQTAFAAINVKPYGINFQPIPNTTYGIEAGAMGATIPMPVPGDPNNQLIEAEIINAQAQQIMQEFQLNVGANGIPDPGDFTFSGVDDLVFDAKKAAKTSYADTIQELTTRRTQLANDGLNALKTIEIIVGEFSGLGLLDIFAIQAAMWIVPPSVLASMIDVAAFNRMTLRDGISTSGVSQSGDVIAALKQFETVVVSMYKLIDAYIQNLTSYGKYIDIQPG